MVWIQLPSALTLWFIKIISNQYSELVSFKSDLDWMHPGQIPV